MNKFQEALDYICGDYTYDSGANWENAIITLQELIDKYNNMLGDYMSYQDLKAEYESQLNLYKNLYNEALNHLEITLGQDKETINELLRKVVNGK